MPNTVAKGFEILSERLGVTDLQASSIAQRHERIRAVLKKALPVIDGGDFLTGSYMRKTMIAPLNEADIDIFIVLDKKYRYDYNPASLLDRVKYILQQEYSEATDISRDGQAVTISFSDFKVDVVPAFPRKIGFAFQKRYRGFIIANTLQKAWIATDPREHITIWSEANKKHDGKLIPLIKMIKGWNKENGSLITSFHLECLILQIMKDQTISDFPMAVGYIFNKARHKIYAFIADPAGYNYNVGAYLNSRDKRAEVKSHLETAFTRAKKAEEYAKAGKIEEAYLNWRLVFGKYFPAYN